MIFLSAAVCAIGNRTWGAGDTPLGAKSGTLNTKHWMGLLVMTFAKALSYPVRYWPFLLAGLLFWRGWTTGPWLDMSAPATANWMRALVRSLAVIPLAALEFYIDHSYLHMVLGSIDIALVPAVYWVTGKCMKTQFIEAAEFINGALVGGT